ncbi:MAG: hypothetical protein LBH58_02645 [Tannerellaceae bacterium]|jgi:hypothetical protein|nr:hypothetical protein [Tannerellaceae bacterium]
MRTQGSRLGKEYSTNALNERYLKPMQNRGADLQIFSGEANKRQINTTKKFIEKTKGKKI